MAKAELTQREMREYQTQVLGEHRGRRPKVPYETGELRKVQKKEAAYAFNRLTGAARSQALKKSNFTAWQDLNRWLYEIYHGRPKMAVEGQVKMPIQVSFTLAEPKEQKQLPQGKNDGSIEDREGIPALTTTTD